METRQLNLHKILEKRMLTDSTFVLRFERNGMEFEPGQHIQVGPPNGINVREYSIYSSPDKDYIEILVKEIKEGLVTPALKKLNVGDSVIVNDAVGYFNIEESNIETKKFLFVSTGTGISPFHCFADSYSNLDYILLHGIRTANEQYENDSFEEGRYISCVSKEEGGNFNGRVTEWLEKNPINSDTLCYLCGNYDMIYDVYDILEKQGVKPSQIFTEVYF